MGCKTCEKPKVSYRKGIWSPEEDQKLRDYIMMHGHNCWSSVPEKAGLQRNAKSCRLRWINYLRPGLKHGVFSPREEATVIKLHEVLGNKWSRIAMHLPGRTDNEIKNYWNSHLKKKITTAEGPSPHAFSTPSSQDMTCAQMRPSDSSSSTESHHACSRHGSSPRAKQPLFPAIFADWLPLDHAAAGQSSACSASDVNWQCDSSSNSDVMISELLEVVLSRKHEIVHGSKDISICRELQSQLEHEHEEQIPGGSFDDHIFSIDETGGSSFELDQIFGLTFLSSGC